MRIEAENISKQFGDFTALDNVSLDVPEGALTALLGPVNRRSCGSSPASRNPTGEWSGSPART